MDSTIFPKCRVDEQVISQREYVTNLIFERDEFLDFDSDVVFTISLSVDVALEAATRLSFKAVVNGQEIAAAAWTEMFTVESAFAVCRRSFLDAAESVVSA